MVLKYMSQNSARARLIYTGSIVALGCAITLSVGGLVQSQPVTPAPRPAESPAEAQPVLNGDQVDLLVRLLNDAEGHGFQRGEFVPANINDLLQSKDPAEQARGQALLAQAAVAYAQAQHGRFPKSGAPDDWGIEPTAYDAAADFRFALAQDKLAQWALSLPPPFERYRALKTALGQYRTIAGRGGWRPIAAGAPLKPGMTDPRVVQLRRRLAAENPPGSIELNSPVYDPKLAAVVAAAQARYGLTADSIVGAGALKEFNKPVEARIAQIAANMERWRWMPRAWPATRIEVNIPDAHLLVFDDNKQITEMKVVVGQPDTRTPMLQSEIHSVVINPPWNVPDSIASKELLPKGADYLARNGFQWVSSGGKSRLQQKPGPGNSLGRLKFDFQNPYGVYLHDTNAKTAFGRDARSISHGCVRVERPEELANMLLGADSRWDETSLQAAIDNMETVRASLPQKIPLIIAYWTVFTADNGEVNFRPDVYDWDQKLAELTKSQQLAALRPDKLTAKL
jgi:murein L,D-transpeptidase YcbB/YkuD